MKVTINHKKTQAEAVELVDKGAKGLFAGAAGPSVEITEMTKNWVGPVMHFAFTAKFGFISLPLNGTIDVGSDHIAVVECALPSLVDKFIGSDKVQAVIEKKVQLLLE